jgi:hypothetical protein
VVWRRQHSVIKKGRSRAKFRLKSGYHVPREIRILCPARLGHFLEFSHSRISLKLRNFVAVILLEGFKCHTQRMRMFD